MVHDYRRTHDENSTVIIETSFNTKRALGSCVITGFLKDGKGYRKFQEVHIERGYKVLEVEDLLRKAGFAFKKYDGSTLSNSQKAFSKTSVSLS